MCCLYNEEKGGLEGLEKEENFNSSNSSNSDSFLDSGEVLQMSTCLDHFFHTECLYNLYKSSNSSYIKCPVCFTINGIMTGEQPDGTMKVRITKAKCEGFKCDSLEIQYYFPGGKNSKINRKRSLFWYW